MYRAKSYAHNLFWSQNEEKPTSTVPPKMQYLNSFRSVETSKTSCSIIIADAGGGEGDSGEWRKWRWRRDPHPLVVGRGKRGPVGLGRGVIPERLRRKLHHDAFQGLRRRVPLRRLHGHSRRRWPASLWHPQG